MEQPINISCPECTNDPFREVQHDSYSERDRVPGGYGRSHHGRFRIIEEVSEKMIICECLACSTISLAGDNIDENSHTFLKIYAKTAVNVLQNVRDQITKLEVTQRDQTYPVDNFIIKDIILANIASYSRVLFETTGTCRHCQRSVGYNDTLKNGEGLICPCCNLEQ